MEPFWKRYGGLFHLGRADKSLLRGNGEGKHHNSKGTKPHRVNLAGTRVHHSYCGRHIGKP